MAWKALEARQEADSPLPGRPCRHPPLSQLSKNRRRRLQCCAGLQMSTPPFGRPWPLNARLLYRLLHPATPPSLKEGNRSPNDPCIRTDGKRISCHQSASAFMRPVSRPCLLASFDTLSLRARRSRRGCNDKTRKPPRGPTRFCLSPGFFLPNVCAQDQDRLHTSLSTRSPPTPPSHTARLKRGTSFPAAHPDDFALSSVRSSLDNFP